MLIFTMYSLMKVVQLYRAIAFRSAIILCLWLDINTRGNGRCQKLKDDEKKLKDGRIQGINVKQVFA